MIFRNRCHGPLRQRQSPRPQDEKCRPPSCAAREGGCSTGRRRGVTWRGDWRVQPPGSKTQREAFQMAMNSSALRRSSETAGQPMSFCSSWGRAFIRRAALLERWALAKDAPKREIPLISDMAFSSVVRQLCGLLPPFDVAHHAGCLFLPDCVAFGVVFQKQRYSETFVYK